MMAQHHSVLYTATPGAEIFPGVRDMASQTGEGPVTVYAAIAANVIITIAKFVAAFATRSSAMLAESIHSLVDVGNEVLLLFGVHRSRKKADERHPFGYGKEIYFWGLIVALLLFSIGGGMSIYEGITHIEHPVEISNPIWNYIVLGIALVADSTSWTIAFRELRKKRQPGENMWQTLRHSKDPSVFTVLGEDTADILGIVTAFAGVFLSHQLKNPIIDGIASIVVGAILILVAVFLVGESKSLIVGESADQKQVRKIRQLVEADSAIQKVPKLLTLQFGPNDVLVNMDIQFKPNLSALQMFNAIDRLEQNIRDQHPDAKQIFIEAECLKSSANGSHPAP
jgi:cation diffusion facilitator family transporter